MTDRNVEFPQRYRLIKVEGTDDIYDLIPAPGDILAEGTMVSKATMLSDATEAKLFGDANDRTVDNALAGICTQGTATIPTTGWTGSSGAYTCTLSVAGLLDTDRPHIGPVFSHTDAAADALIQQAWNSAVSRGAEAVAGAIILYGTAVPEVNIPMQWEVVR